LEALALFVLSATSVTPSSMRTCTPVPPLAALMPPVSSSISLHSRSVLLGVATGSNCLGLSFSNDATAIKRRSKAVSTSSIANGHRGAPAVVPPPLMGDRALVRSLPGLTVSLNCGVKSLDGDGALCRSMSAPLPVAVLGEGSTSVRLVAAAVPGFTPSAMRIFSTPFAALSASFLNSGE
jgi:hypothetical protein